MSFNKGFLDRSVIDKKYSEGGIESIKKLLNSYDTFVCQDDYTSKLIDYYLSDELDEFYKLGIY